MSASLGLCTPGGGGGGGGGGGVCTAPPGGSPTCSGSGPATQGGGATPSSGAGNPINILNGNKYQEESDLAALPGVLGLELKRYYNSQSTHPGLLGANWRMSYETVLYDLGSEIQIVQADGRRLMFQRGIGQSATLCSSPQPQDGQVRIEPAKDGKGQPTYYWRWADGRTLMFSSGSGGGYPLQSITAATGERVTLNYSPTGEITSIRDPQGRQLVFIYASAAEKRSRALKAIDTPLGRLTYSQDALGRLTEVGQAKDTTSAPFVTRLYHYEDRYSAGHPQALTGISVRGPDPQTHQITEQRLSTYVYNAAGMAILSTKGRPKEMKDGKQVADTGIEQVEVAYLDKPLPQDVKVDRKTGEATPTRLGRVVLTNSLGQTTQVTSALIAGHFRLMEMRGPGCSTCGPGNMRYAYDAQGLLIRSTKLDDNGAPVRSEITELDKYGRTARVGVQSYQANKAQPTHWTQRFEYPDVRYPDGSVAVAPQPSLVEQPSVVPGKVHTVAMSYNGFGQVVQVTEAGLSPVGATGELDGAGTSITRSTIYRYRTIAGKSLLEEVDGPLPNGPKGSPEDSDVIRLSWDGTGTQVVSFSYPMGLNASAAFDAKTGLLTIMTGPSGVSDVYRYGAQGEVMGVRHWRGEQMLGGSDYRYDLRGRRSEVIDLLAGKEIPQALFAYDIADRLLWQADKLGVLRRATYDTEDHMVRSEVFAGTVQQEERYLYDAHGRLERVEDSTGAIRQLVRDPSGRVAASVDPLGRITSYIDMPDRKGMEITEAANTSKPLAVRYGTDASGGFDEIAASANDGVGGSRWITTRLIKDDFGREVLYQNPDSGAVSKRYDSADHLLQTRDADGTLTELSYDLAGRVVRRSVKPGGEGAVESVTHYVYRGKLLVEIGNANQTEAYGYDDHDLLTSKTVVLRLADGASATSEERYRYDRQGRLAARVLPDGSELRYERDGDGQISAMSRQTGAWAPFGWGRTTLAAGLDGDLIGLRRLTYGNGVVGQWQRSREGVLARVVYSSPLDTPSGLRTAFENLMTQARAQGDTANAEATSDASSIPGGGIASPGAFGLASTPQVLWDSRLLYDLSGNVLVRAQFARTAVATPSQTAYLYDDLNQLAQAAQAPERTQAGVQVADRTSDVNPTYWRYHDDSLGNRLLAQQPQSEVSGTQRTGDAASNGDRLSGAAFDAAGRPRATHQRQLAWDGDGRLIKAIQAGRPTAQYGYDARGLRISKQVGDDVTYYLYDERRQRSAELDAKGRIVRQYVWLADRLVTVIDLGTARSTEVGADGIWARLGTLVASAWRALIEHGDVLSYVHTDHLGAPVAMTDANARPVWAAELAPFGQRLGSVAAPGLDEGRSSPGRLEVVRLDLRLPGQWEDEETGLYYNDQRYYDPSTGRYLTPDPSGLQGGLNGYAYVGNNPLGFADPLGLVLFAFDGTNNDQSNSATLSNVVYFKNNYQDGQVYYITGVGTDDPTTGIKGGTWDAAHAGTGKDRITAMINDLNTYSDGVADDKSFNIDIVGFSRGAAEARDFASQIAAKFSGGYYHYVDAKNQAHCQMVNFNFMGLWDTVLSYHAGTYNLAIPPAFKYVAQAAALNEYRDGTFLTFPSESLLGVPTPANTTRIEKGFLGSHSDIGGSFPEGDLAKIAMQWMVNQAKLAGVNVLSSSTTIIANPVIHDKSNCLKANQVWTKCEDRDVRYANGTTGKQRTTTGQGMTWADTQQFITYKAKPNDKDNISGTVDAKKYLAWLNAHGYGLENMSVN